MLPRVVDRKVIHRSDEDIADETPSVVQIIRLPMQLQCHLARKILVARPAHPMVLVVTSVLKPSVLVSELAVASRAIDHLVRILCSWLNYGVVEV